MKKDKLIDFKKGLFALMVLCGIGILLIPQVSAAGININVPIVEQNTTVFIGEEGLDISNALIDPNTGNPVYLLGWWGDDVESGGHTSADKYITIAPGSVTNYYVNPTEYMMNNRYTEGSFYICDETTGQAIYYNGYPVVAFYVELPHLELVPADDVCPDVNRTGQVFLGTNLNFNIKTNLYKIQNRPGGQNSAIFDINVIGPNGKDYNYLLGPDAGGCNCPDCNPNYPAIGIKDINILTNKHQWQTWDTDAIDPQTGLLYSPQGTYAISATCWANHILDNYVTIGGAKSATTNLELVVETVSVTVNPGTILRTETATATVTGKPQTEYIIALMECPLKMTGEICDRPPWFENDPLNVALQFDPEGGPYTIGKEIVYPSCCDGLTFRDVVPKVYHDGVLYYASITTDCLGKATIDIKVDNTVWKADNNPVYTIHVQKRAPECNGIHLFAETELTVKKGDISIQISQASDTTNAPITEAYLGDTLKIAGSNTDSLRTYLYMTGPCQPECGGGLIPIPYPHGPIGDGPEVIDVSLPPIEGFDWIFTNNDATGKPRYWETRYLPMNPGTYTIWAISNWPPNCPNCLDCGGHPCFTNPETCPGCDGKVCSLLDCPNCDVYAVATIELKAPELTAITEDIERCCCSGYPCGTTIDSHPINVSGVSTGNPKKELNVWLFGKGKIGDEKFMNIKVPVNCDGTFVFDVVKDILGYYGIPLCRIDSGTYDLIIQDAGYNHQYDVIYEDDLDPSIWARPVEVNKKWIIMGHPDIGPVENYSEINPGEQNPNEDFLTHVDTTTLVVPDPDSQKFYDDDWRKLVQVEGPGYKLGTEVLYALIKGLDDPSVDDNYVHIQFTVTDKSCLVGTDFDADRTYGNKPLTVRFTDKSYNATSWLWNFGDGTTSTEQNPTHTFTEEGRYTISLTTNGDDKGKAVKNDYIRVAKGPTAKFAFAPKDVTVGTEVQFTDLSSGNPTSWMWHFGDGSSSPLQSPVYTYLTPGVYTVMLTVSDETGISGDSATQTITVQGSSTPVVADFKTEVTNGTNVQFTDLSSGFGITSWVWDFGDGSTSTERNPKHTYLKEGTYQVSLTVSNGSYENTAKKPIGIR